MLENPRSARVRAVARLAKRRVREETGQFPVEGPQAVREVLAYRPADIVELYATEAALARHTDIRDTAASRGIEVVRTSGKVLDAMADTVTPQGVLAVARQFPARLDDILREVPQLIAVCEQVRDPGNLGTIIRAADAAGADAVILTGRTVDPYNPKVVRATTGSLFHIPICSAGRLADVVDAARAAGLRVIAADVKGGDLLAASRSGALAQPTAWLFGNEARGLHDDAVSLADDVLRLPIYGHAESLNLATAASVCLYQSAFAHRTAPEH